VLIKEVVKNPLLRCLNKKKKLNLKRNKMAIKKKFSGSAPMKGKKSGVSTKGTGRPAPAMAPSAGPAMGPGPSGMASPAGGVMKKGGIVKKKKK
jgi:hypothetical protein